MTGPLGVYRGLDLTADQKSKMSDLMKKYKSKLRSFDHRMHLEGLLTPEQKKARQQAVKEARDAGKDPATFPMRATRPCTHRSAENQADKG